MFKYLAMPVKVKGCTVLFEDYETILINPCYCRDAQEDTYRHELSHENDFGVEQNVDELEAMRHEETD